MTDNEIIKALECCSYEGGDIISCIECPEYKFNNLLCIKDVMNKALDLINRQKAEIERLKQQPIGENVIKTIQIDILKVFAERLKAKVENIPWCEYHLVHTEIDNLVKEMTEVQE